MEIIIEVSARHIHISQNDLDILFGKNYKLTKFKDLSLPGEFAAQETVEIHSSQSKYKLRVLGPAREFTQVELSQTDCKQLGLEAPERLSGDIKDSPGIKIVGPKGVVELPEGVIIAKRHVHLDEETAKQWGVSDGQEVSVKIKKSEEVILENTIVRVSSEFNSTMHIDVDEAKEIGIRRGETEIGEIVI